jgi:serine/threonine-protein kinase HipA
VHPGASLQVESNVAGERRVVDVVADWHGLSEPMSLGTLTTTASRGKEVFAFEFSSTWLAREDGRALDPALRLLRGAQYAAVDKGNFGLFLDSSPDRWGRVLLARREAVLSRAEKRAERRLTELDYLLGVYDGHRMGGLRFRCHTEKSAAGPFLDDNVQLASPPWTSLRELEHASLKLQDANVERDASYVKWLTMLLAPGRSLGGARPKASVVDPKGHLWIAKFPSVDDLVDVGAWEQVVQRLAHQAGIDVAPTQCKLLGSKHHTFLSRRFDRTTAGTRIHFASAMTMLDRRDGEDGASYLELARFIAQHGARPAENLEQLWRRIVFSMCVSNVDDHLRNHGFLLAADGWLLAPAYDINPVATGDGLTLNVSETDNAQDLALALDVAKHFRIKGPRAAAIVRQVQKVVAAWPVEAKKLRISRAAQEAMAPAFRLVSG